MDSNQVQPHINPLPSGSVICAIAAWIPHSTWLRSARAAAYQPVVEGWACAEVPQRTFYKILRQITPNKYVFPQLDLVMIRRPYSWGCLLQVPPQLRNYLHYLLSYSIYSRHKKLILTHIHFTGFDQLPQYIFLTIASILGGWVWKGPKMCWLKAGLFIK